ncbi:uncharacterized protein DFL_002121 [Arthrobotrys flagrans]|uniref:Uncharacterized protein n=1 Tax=Arthrobotrys flagrans TaxID=97331 RepID=A0A437A9Z9_ARTFL|nr:hypothetical protein DFL_002121 [Arthrobotrys flagrans]
MLSWSAILSGFLDGYSELQRENDDGDEDEDGDGDDKKLITPSEERMNAYWDKKTDKYGKSIPKKPRNKPETTAVPPTTPNRKKSTMNPPIKKGIYQAEPDYSNDPPGWEWGRPRSLRVEPLSKPRYDPLADTNRIIEQGRREVEALRRAIEAKERHGELTGRLPGLTDKLSEKMAQLELYNTSEEARMQHAWDLARGHDNKVRELAKRDKENKLPGAGVPDRYRKPRDFWSHAKEERDMIIDAAARIIIKEAGTRRRRAAAPITAICQRTRYLTVEQRDHIGGWVVNLPEEFEGSDGLAPVPTYG